MSDKRQEFRTEMRRLMGARTQAQLAKEIGVSQQALSLYLSGQKAPRLPKVITALIRWQPRLLRFFLPEETAQRVVILSEACSTTLCEKVGAVDSHEEECDG